jgi:membrane protease YdiL (CAAX protease family)
VFTPKGQILVSRAQTLIGRYPTTAFFILTFILSFGAGALADAIYADTNSLLLAMPFALLSPGPLVAALFVTGVIGGRAGIAALLRKFLIWRVGWHWYAIALFLPPAIHFCAIYLNVAFGAPAPTAATFGPWTGVLVVFLIRLVNPLDGPMLEELGWRGFAQPRLQQRFTPLTANLILGVLVSLWHLKYLPSGNYEWIYIPATMAATILFGWVYNATGGSVLLTLLMHVTEGIVRTNFEGADGDRYMKLLVLAYVCAAIIVVALTGRNLGRKEQVETQPEMERAPAPA